MSNAGLHVEDLRVRFGGLVAVDGANLDVPPGRITGLIGPNGAGKTTTFNACSGLVNGDGQITLNGRDVAGLNPTARARLGLGRTFQKLELFDRLTVRQNIELGHEATLVPRRIAGQLWAKRSERILTKQAAAEAIELCGIHELVDRRAGSLSTGQKRLLELAMTVVGGFSILLLDEPSSGLDLHETEQFGQILRNIVSEQTAAILLVEHDMALVSDVCEYLYVLDFGRPLIDGPAATVLASDALAAAYLGSDAADNSPSAGITSGV